MSFVKSGKKRLSQTGNMAFVQTMDGHEVHSEVLRGVERIILRVESFFSDPTLKKINDPSICQ